VQRIYTIQYLRALAALAVLVHHLAFGAGDWFPVGSFGVDIFFVISGFIMVAMTANKGRGVGQFVIDRVARIVPTYWFVTLLSAAGAFVKPWVFGIQSPTPTAILSSLLFLPQATPPVVPQGWTLNLEMFFYALFAATLVFSRRTQIIFLSAILASLVLFGLLADIGDGSDKIYLTPRLLEFVGGLFIGELWLQDRLSNRALGVMCVALGLLAAQMGATILRSAILEIWVVASILIVAGALICENQFKLPKIKSLATIGDASYVIYLIHTPFVQILKIQHWLPVFFQITIAVATCVIASLAALPIERMIVRHTRLRLSQGLELASTYVSIRG
jgi:exopolysaccharide production protein ExoZ